MINKKIIKKIENLNIGSKQKAELILSYLGLKPAAHIQIHHKNTNSLAKTLDKINMPYKISKPFYLDKEDSAYKPALKYVQKYFPKYFAEKIQKNRNKRVQAYIAQDKKTLSQLLETELDKDLDKLDKDYHRKYGRFMGYPETAIQAFLRERERLTNFPSEVDSSISPALDFVLSKSHYQQELGVLKNQSEALRTYAPSVYKKMIKDYSS
mgnify:CR=1 FL=1